MNRGSIGQENGQDNDRDRFCDTESGNRKAVAADRKLLGTSPSTISDAIMLMTISNPMRRWMRITFLVLRMGDVDEWQKAKTVRWEEVLGIRHSILASIRIVSKVSTSKGAETGWSVVNGE